MKMYINYQENKNLLSALYKLQPPPAFQSNFKSRAMKPLITVLTLILRDFFAKIRRIGHVHQAPFFLLLLLA